jgi:ubiquinone/menaquinone biosynthesis C-methylase UbiE
MNNKSTIGAYRKFSKYYDAYVRGFKKDTSFYLSFCDKTDKILEVGCGTGRVLKHLLDNGLTNITGIDISEEMLALAKKNLAKYLNNNDLILKNHNFEIESLKSSYNKIFVSFYTFNYILKNPAKFLKNIYLSMGKSSEIILDLFYPKTLSNPDAEGKWIERAITLDDGKEVNLKDKRTFDGKFEERVQIFMENKNKTEIETIRRFYDKNEIGNLLEESGFKKIEFTDNYRIDNFHKLNTGEEINQNFQVRALKKT